MNDAKSRSCFLRFGKRLAPAVIRLFMVEAYLGLFRYFVTKLANGKAYTSVGQVKSRMGF